MHISIECGILPEFEPVHEGRCDDPEENLFFLNQEDVRNVNQHLSAMARKLFALGHHAFLHVVFSFVRGTIGCGNKS